MVWVSSRRHSPVSHIKRQGLLAPNGENSVTVTQFLQRSWLAFRDLLAPAQLSVGLYSVDVHFRLLDPDELASPAIQTV